MVWKITLLARCEL